MSWITNIVRYFVGILFIISGLVKANDPLGLSYKMQEFFEVWSSDLAGSAFFAKQPLLQLLHFLHDYTLLLSIIMITLEIVAGVALILGWRKIAVLRLLSLLIVFFTFLTAYAYGSGKFKNCGCFGDCLPISPLASLLKDILLLVLIGVLWFGRKHVRPLLPSAPTSLALFAALVLTLGMQWYVLNYLPFVDCLPFKKGSNIAKQMQIPEGALPDSFAIRFVYEKGGKNYEFDASNLPADLASYKYVDRVDKLIRKGNAEPPIKGFALTGISGTDSTQVVLDLPEAYLLFTERLENENADWMVSFKNLVSSAQKSGVPVFVATSAPLHAQLNLFQKNGLGTVPVFALDFTAVRTAARTNPTLYYLKKGTIQEKFSFRRIDEASHASF